MSYYSLSALFNTFVSVMLGIYVLTKNPRAKMNRNLFFWCLAVAFWSFFYFVWQIEVHEERVLLWIRLLMFGAVWVPVAFFKVVVIFLKQEKKRKNLLIFNDILGIIFSFLLFTPLMVKGVAPVLVFAFWPQPGWMYFPFLMMFFGLTLYGASLSFQALEGATPVKQAQIKLMLFGIVISIIGGSTNYFLWYGINIPPFGNIFASVYVIFTAYAIIAHRLMDIKFAMRKYFVFLISLSTALLLVMILKYFVEVSIGRQIVVADFFVMMLTLLLFPTIKSKYYYWANKYFFSSLYDGQELIAKLSEELGRTLDIQKIYNMVYEVLLSALHFKSFVILKYSKINNNYLVQFNQGMELAGKKMFSSNEYLFSMLEQENNIIIVDELRNSRQYEKIKDFMDTLAVFDVQLLVPLKIKNKIMGLLVFGPKQSGDLYNDEDVKTLQIISSQVAMAIENASLYEKTIDFNIKLAHEVEKATYDLRRGNEKLKKLDKAKSEFISIASHQLRTPLTVIKGYISMMLEESFGKLSEAKRDALTKVYESNERLIKLVENLLNISRIESGRVQFMFEEMHLEDIVDSVIDELEKSAEKKNLKLHYKRPKALLPSVKLDSEKIRQVVMNLIDNSIKYTASGSVTVMLKKKGTSVEFSVSDTGIGISKTDIKTLFKKFARGKDVSLIHTEGTGLGLYVAKQMIRYHKGKIWAESKGVGKGSKFIFTLPILK